MSKRKANIRPDLVGELFTDGDNVFRLVRCETEPLATFNDITKPEQGIITKPISAFANLVQLKPVRLIEKPKKPRADLGKKHKKQASTPSIEKSQEIVDKKGTNMTIHVPTGLKGDTEYKVSIAGSEASGPESVGLRRVVLTALEEWSGKIPDELTEQERATIQGILDA